MYVLIVNGLVTQYPYTLQQLKRDNPGVTFPKKPSDALLASYGVFKVTEVTPTQSATQVVEYSETPALIDGQWQLVHTLRDKTTAELAVDIGNECERRIYAVASDNAQKNLNANYNAGELSEEQAEVYFAGVRWINQCQQAARTLIAASETDYKKDSHWPAPTQAMIDLAKLF